MLHRIADTVRQESTDSWRATAGYSGNTVRHAGAILTTTWQREPVMPRLMPVLLDLLMATMDSPSSWSAAAGDRAAGLAWRDAVTDRRPGR